MLVKHFEGHTTFTRMKSFQEPVKSINFVQSIFHHKINNGNEANLLADNGVTLGNV